MKGMKRKQKRKGESGDVDRDEDEEQLDPIKLDIAESIHNGF